jgi:Clp amino terminal domain, pathogenicity island component
MPMFERFTDRARRVVVLAQEEARRLDHDYIGTEHLLLGLVREGEGIAALALTRLDISLEGVRAEVKAIVGQGREAPGTHIPFTPRAKKVLELSLREALQLGHDYIGTEHILLGLMREGEGVAAQVLVKSGADLSRVRQQVTQLLAGYAGEGPSEQPPGPPARLGEQAVTAMVAGGPGLYRDQEPPELVRVVPVGREVYHGDGLRIVLISLEIWSGWLDLRYAVLPEASPAAEAEVLLAWRVTDDAGTAYEHMGMATGGGRLLRVTQLGFRPAPPERARVLTLTVTSGTELGPPLAVVEIDLAGG